MFVVLFSSPSATSWSLKADGLRCLRTDFHSVPVAWLQAGITENLLSYLRSKCLQTSAKSFFICSVSLWAGFFNVRLSVVAHFWHIWTKHLWQPKLEFRSLWEQWGNPAHWWRPMSLHDRGQGKSNIVRKGELIQTFPWRQRKTLVFWNKWPPSIPLLCLFCMFCYYNGLCFQRIWKTVFIVCLRPQAKGILMIKLFWLDV